MKRESAIVTTFTIERPKQAVLFQVRIPREAKNIIGVEMGLTWISGIPPVTPTPLPWVLPMEIKRNLPLGEMKLQSYEKANMFYTGELTINQNIAHADFTSERFTPQVFTHQLQSNEDVVQVNGNTTIIQGVYRDKLADHQAGDYKYTVRVYVWTEAKIDQSDL